MKAPRTISEQLAAMKADWPMLRASDIDRRAHSARWIGHLRPQFSSCRIEIRFEGGRPEVRILSPQLRSMPDNPEGLLPHVYGPIEDPTLCLFDPAADEWDPSMLLSKTIVPWALDWIVCYEFWLMTGKWTGGGRHPGEVTANEDTS